MDLMAWMEQWNMLPRPGGTVLCAVSGGRDSMCLLHCLHALSLKRDFRVAAAHLNHGMRPTAQRDEELVRRFCEERDIPFYVGYEKVYDRAREWDLGVEETGRRLRYAFLERTADEIGAERIATAHHRRDQAETVLLNLLRGTGPEGLGGIPPVRGRLARPLLNTSRAEIEAYVAENGIPYAEDETNADLHYARNRLRLVIWPELEKINGAAAENVTRAAAIVRRESAFLDELASSYLPCEGTAVSCKALLSAPEVLRPRILRLLIDRLGCGKKDFGQVHLAALERLARTGGTLDLPSLVRAVCRDGLMTLEMTPDRVPGETALEGGQPVMWGDFTICLRRTGDVADAVSIPPNCTLTVRPWRSGDRLTLPGSRGARSLKRLFADAGIPPACRDRAPVLCVDGKAAAAYGVGTDVSLLPPANGEMYVIDWKHNNGEDEKRDA
ncbi:MAG: tRNA lysidine(34) synthetase TilS [Oscillospiraceae bacterium]|nr:tRNA lysidine(34) synthetase TilS [Oscillospiraceae bacterium]